MMKKMKIMLSVAAILSIAVNVFAAKIDNYFEYAKNNEALLTAFLHKMPKGADLENNLSYAGYGEYMIDYAIKNNLAFDRQTQKIVADTKSSTSTKKQTAAQKAAVDAANSSVWTASDLAYNSLAYAEALRALSANATIAKSANAVDYYETVRRILTRAVNQNILYVELTASLQGEDYEYWLDRIEAIRKDVAAKAKRDFYLGIILPIDANETSNAKLPFDEKEYLSYFNDKVSAIMAAAVKFRDKGIVGVSLSLPDGWVARNEFDVQINVINRYWTAYEKRGALINMSIQSGFMTAQQSPYESIIDNIAKSVRFGHAKRIGAGTSIAWENNVYALLEYMRDNGIAVEIIPSADENILKVFGASKSPFLLYRDAGVPITINTNAEEFLRSNLTAEYVKAAINFNLSYNDIKRLAFNALEYSFIAGESLFDNGNYSKPKKAFPSNSKKALLQRKLLNEFNEFEGQMTDIIKNDFPNVK
ncbi:MAG: hypothetical protein LBN20_03105 [Endomicrobium sp.]|jgi:hypothetical protein|nr:hypothetical protein [Endomicrobium sp.]